MKTFGKFLTVGLSNTALSFLVYLALVRTGTPYCRQIRSHTSWWRVATWTASPGGRRKRK